MRENTPDRGVQTKYGGGAHDPSAGFVPPPDCIEAYGFDPRKTWPFMAMLVVLIAIGVGRVAVYGMGENWLPTLVLLAFPVIAFVMVGQEMRLRGPIIVIAERGLLDRRHGSDFVPWDQIAEAEIKKRPFMRGIRIKLTNGERYDLELILLRAEPMPIMQAIRQHAEAATANMAPESSRRWW
ncbi:MAG: hypothetical protein JJU21_18035 [Salinarimonas sp.]|nr:hypothetical protein [Salinarimonas sp.]